MFKDGILLITGGTGSFGNAVLRRFLNTSVSEIRIFSRDEKKQDDMRKGYGNAKLKFYIGDVRDRSSVEHAMRGVDFVFHAAAPRSLSFSLSLLRRARLAFAPACTCCPAHALGFSKTNQCLRDGRVCT